MALRKLTSKGDTLQVVCEAGSCKIFILRHLTETPLRRTPFARQPRGRSRYGTTRPAVSLTSTPFFD